MKLFEKKVLASEKLEHFPPSQNVFDNYFQKDIFGMSPQTLIVELTWCNPRDLVLLFGAAATAADHDRYFGEQVLSRVLDKFSTDAWLEKTEELNVEYPSVEIQSIKKILLNFRRYFKLTQFHDEGKRKATNDQNVMSFIKRRNLAKVLEDLYRIGIIGQSSKEPVETARSLRQFKEHWAYRGDENFDPNAWMIVHRALWPDLRLGRISANRGTEPIFISTDSTSGNANSRTRRRF